MYCANCGTPVSPELSYCNRCGFNLRERVKTNSGVFAACLSAIAFIAVFGLGIMFGGAMSLKRAGFSQDFIAFFLFWGFVLVGGTEIMLFRTLTKLGVGKQKERPALPSPVQHELNLPPASNFGEPVSSVTDHTTRTLEHARREH